ncbi:MAG TPA: hypothetical protein VGC22_06390 [Chitinophaga sp.]
MLPTRQKNAVVLLGLAAWLLLAFRPAPGDGPTCCRIRWFYRLKEQLSGEGWPGFAEQRYDVALAYFTASHTYFTDPGRQIIGRRPLLPADTSARPRIYRGERLDSTAFHMATNYEAQDSSRLWYHYPVMLCSDYETVHAEMPDVQDLQTWATMVMHEYFHGFQFRHAAFIRYANDSVTISGARLQSYYDDYAWYRKSIEAENTSLLNALASRDEKALRAQVKQFLQTRARRRKQAGDTLGFPLAPQEAFLEKMEGSARYMEYQLYQAFKTHPVALETDTAYKAAAMQQFSLETVRWMYESSSIRYFYSTGFNMLRLLDKLNIRYKARFFDDNRLTPEALLSRWAYRQPL